MIIPGHSVEPSKHRLISLAVALALVCGSVRICLADATNSAASDSSIDTPPNVGSVDDYVNNRDSYYGPAVKPSYVPPLGISVFKSEGKLASGEKLSGLAVTSVDLAGPGHDAGIREQRLRMTKAAGQVGAAALMVGAAAFFPPVLLGVPMLSKKMGSPRAYDVIVAIDGERIREVSELEDYLHKAKAGETIYVTIIREGQRVQLRVPMRAVASAPTPLLPK
jgi:hypothetical protein